MEKKTYLINLRVKLSFTRLTLDLIYKADACDIKTAISIAIDNMLTEINKPEIVHVNACVDCNSL